MGRIRTKLAPWAWPAVLVLGAFWAGTWFPSQAAVTAEVRQGPRRAAFMAGSERAVPVLEEISATLKQIDARLARFEKILAPDDEK